MPDYSFVQAIISPLTRDRVIDCIQKNTDVNIYKTSMGLVILERITDGLRVKYVTNNVNEYLYSWADAPLAPDEKSQLIDSTQLINDYMKSIGNPRTKRKGACSSLVHYLRANGFHPIKANTESGYPLLFEPSEALRYAVTQWAIKDGYIYL